MKTSDIASITETLTPDAQWDVTRTIAEKGVYQGEQITKELLPVLVELPCVPERYLTGADVVVVLGRHRLDDRQARFAHVFWFDGDQISKVWQVADTAVIKGA